MLNSHNITGGKGSPYFKSYYNYFIIPQQAQKRDTSGTQLTGSTDTTTVNSQPG